MPKTGSGSCVAGSQMFWDDEVPRSWGSKKVRRCGEWTPWYFGFWHAGSARDASTGPSEVAETLPRIKARCHQMKQSNVSGGEDSRKPRAVWVSPRKEGGPSGILQGSD
jgi:hypothetical protein